MHRCTARRRHIIGLAALLAGLTATEVPAQTAPVDWAETVRQYRQSLLKRCEAADQDCLLDCAAVAFDSRQDCTDRCLDDRTDCEKKAQFASPPRPTPRTFMEKLRIYLKDLLGDL